MPLIYNVYMASYTSILRHLAWIWWAITPWLCYNWLTGACPGRCSGLNNQMSLSKETQLSYGLRGKQTFMNCLSTLQNSQEPSLTTAFYQQLVSFSDPRGLDLRPCRHFDSSPDFCREFTNCDQTWHAWAAGSIYGTCNVCSCVWKRSNRKLI